MKNIMAVGLLAIGISAVLAMGPVAARADRDGGPTDYAMSDGGNGAGTQCQEVVISSWDPATNTDTVYMGCW